MDDWDGSIARARGRGRNRGSQRRSAIVTAVALVAVMATTGGVSGAGAAQRRAAADPVPGEDAVSFSQATDLGVDVNWGDRCDTERGTVAIPYFYAAECYAPFTGDNGGATATGVTGDTIKIVWFLDKNDDAVLRYIRGPLNYNDTNADQIATMEGLLAMYETYYETYGRSVELVVVENKSTSTDAVQARAQAAQIAEEIKPFMVWGNPTLAGEQFGEELAARGIPWLSLGGVTNSFAKEHAPYVMGIGKGAVQSRIQLAEYIGKQLAGRKAAHAPDFAKQKRKFAMIYIETSETSKQTADRFEAELKDKYGVKLADVIPYTLDPATIQEQAATIIGRLKVKGITSVIAATDPIAPKDFTQEATAQDYFPEWIISSVALVDTNVFARTYDQKQWTHAFGLSESAAKADPTLGGGYHLYQWFTGEKPPADEQVPLIQPWPGVFYSVLQGVGPNLTPKRFYKTLLGGEPTARGGITTVSLGYGAKKIWPKDLEPDPNGVDDVTEIWWDPKQRGVDENGDQGLGMYQYVDGGKRYLPGDLPKRPTKAFVRKGAVAFYDQRPAAEVAPDYKPLPSRR